METTTAMTEEEDPFAGFPPQPIKCQWLTERDREAAPSADIIRLIVDDQRGQCDPWANDVYQQHFLRDVQDFIGPTRAILVTDAGSIKAYIEPLSGTLDSIRSGLHSLSEAVSRVDLGSMEMLLGVDGCMRGESTHLQTVIHLQGEQLISQAIAVVKLYPTGAERANLVGWRVCEALGRVPDELIQARRINTSVGPILVLVCNDAAIFSARSRSNLASNLGLAIRQHFMQQAIAEPRAKYILIATHWQGINPDSGRWSGDAFRQAAEFLNDETGATVVTTLRAPKPDLVGAASRFNVVGARMDKVATLLVSDTYGD